MFNFKINSLSCSRITDVLWSLAIWKLAIDTPVTHAHTHTYMHTYKYQWGAFHLYNLHGHCLYIWDRIFQSNNRCWSLGCSLAVMAISCKELNDFLRVYKAFPEYPALLQCSCCYILHHYHLDIYAIFDVSGYFFLTRSTPLNKQFTPILHLSIFHWPFKNTFFFISKSVNAHFFSSWIKNDFF